MLGELLHKEAGNISAITTETRNHRLTLWLKRFSIRKPVLTSWIEIVQWTAMGS